MAREHHALGYRKAVSAGLIMLVLAVAGVKGAHADDPVPPAGAGAAEVALQRALDQPLTLNLQKVELSEAFKQIAATAKIALQVDPACYDLLPYGATTRVSVDFKQSKLRDALEEVLIPLGLQEKLAGSTVMIAPSPALAHIGRRADWEELKLLKELWTSSDLKLPTAPGAAFNLTDAVRAGLEGRKDLLVTITGSESPAAGAAASAHDKALEQIAKQLPMSAYRAIEMYCELTGSVWLVEAGALAGGPTGGTIRIMTKKQWIARQLERPIKVARTNEALELFVADLTHASGIRFVPEPGLYQAVPLVNLRSDNASVLQTLEFLAGAQRVAFEVRDDSILLHLVPGPGAAAAAKSDAIVGRISVPVGPNGLMMDVFIKESDLSMDLNESRKKHVQDAVNGLQKTWGTTGGATGAVPATAPAAGPEAQGKEP